MTHTDAFAAMQARKRDAEQARHARYVNWRRVSSMSGGGVNGLGPDGRRAYVAQAPDGLYVYGTMVGPARVPAGAADSMRLAKQLAEDLILG